MRYIIRSIKYFVYYVVILTIFLCILVLTGNIEADVQTMFKNGYDSLWQIAIIFAIFSAIYPRFGYSKRLACGNGNVDELKSEIARIMESHDYKLISEEAGKLVFRKRSPVLRLLKLFEDKVIITSDFGGVSVDGITKDIVRIKSAIEAAQQLGEE